MSVFHFFTEEASALEHSEFLGEIEFMKNVGSHKNISAMLACCTKGDRIFLVVEFAQHGDLLNLLKDKRNTVYYVIVTRGKWLGNLLFYLNISLQFVSLKNIAHRGGPHKNTKTKLLT